MKTAYYIGLDIAKNFFQVHGEDKNGKKIYNKKLSRSKVLEFFANIPQAIIGIEACGSSHFWARKITALGHEVRLIAPKRVKPFVLNNKTDAADAQAICEVLQRPNTLFVQVKNEDQQILAVKLNIRERLKKQSTALINQTRAMLYEFGIIIPQGISKFRTHVSELLGTPLENVVLAEILKDLYEEFLELERRIEVISKEISMLANNNELCSRIMKIEGVGVITATTIVAHYGNASEYKSGRHFASSIGLTPREHSSGGKQKLLGISKRGNRTLRKLLIQGANSQGRHWITKNADNNPRIKWFQGVFSRSNKFKAYVALANKTARIIWAVLTKGIEYNPQPSKI